MLDEFKWFCEARRAVEQHAAAVDQLRYSRARRAFGSPRFYAAYRAWLKEGGDVFYDLISPSLRDQLQCGLVRIETHVLPHRYLNVAAAAMTA